MKILNSSLAVIKAFLLREWTFKYQEIILIKKAASHSFEELLTSHINTKGILTYAAKYGHVEIIKSISEHIGNLSYIGHEPILAATQAGQGNAIKA